MIFIPLGEVIRLSKWNYNAVVRIGSYRPEVVLEKSYAPHFPIGSVVLVQECSILKHINSLVARGYTPATPVEQEAYRSPVTRLDLLIADAKLSYFLAVGRWKDISRDFEFNPDLIEREGTLLDKMFALITSKDESLPNLRRAAMNFAEAELPSNTESMASFSYFHDTDRVALENLVKEKLQKTT